MKTKTIFSIYILVVILLGASLSCMCPHNQKSETSDSLKVDSLKGDIRVDSSLIKKDTVKFTSDTLK